MQWVSALSELLHIRSSVMLQLMCVHVSVKAKQAPYYSYLKHNSQKYMRQLTQDRHSELEFEEEDTKILFNACDLKGMDG